MSEARSNSWHGGKTTPTFAANDHREVTEQARPIREDLSATGCVSERSTEADAGGVKLPFPRQYRMEPKTPWGAHAAKVAIAGRERTRYGYTQFDWVAEVGQTHRASRTPGGRKACW